MHCIPLSCTSSLCNLLFLNLGVYGLVQATVDFGTVLIWYFAVAHTRGGGGATTLCVRCCWATQRWLEGPGYTQGTHHIHHRTTPTNTSNRSACRFGDMCRSARCPWCHPDHSGTTRQPQREARNDMRPPPPPRQRTLAAESAPADKKKSTKLGGTNAAKQLGTGLPHTQQ